MRSNFRSTRATQNRPRRLAPEIEAARDKIVDHFEDRPFAELKEFVQKLLKQKRRNKTPRRIGRSGVFIAQTHNRF